MAEQLIKKDCKTGQSQVIYPETSFQAVKDFDAGISLDKLALNMNHFYLSLVDYSKTNTRLSIPAKYRRTGLWVTYHSCKGNMFTEIYIGEKFDDESWKSEENWKSYNDPDLIKEEVNRVLKWYKS